MMDKFENVNHLVLNFYPDGYSIAVKLNEFPVFTSETILETAKIPYNETSLLDYIENEELPPLLVEMIDSSPKLSQYKIWHNGCLILEVRDKTNLVDTELVARRSNYISINNIKDRTQDECNGTDGNDDVYERSHSAPKRFKPAQDYPSSPIRFNEEWRRLHEANNFHDNNCSDSEQEAKEQTTKKSSLNGESFFVLLKPTNLSMLYDVLNLTDSPCWSYQERLQLESQIVLHSSPRLVLEPDISKLPAQEQSSIWYGPSNKYSQPEQKKRLPHIKMKLNRTGQTRANQSNGGYDFGNNSNINFHEEESESLPFEFTLQQFLASKRAKRKTLPSKFVPKFQRFKRAARKF